MCTNLEARVCDDAPAGVQASIASESMRHASNPTLPIRVITIVTYFGLPLVARMRHSAGTCHHLLRIDDLHHDGGRVCAGGSHPPEERWHNLGRAGPRKGHAYRVPDRR